MGSPAAVRRIHPPCAIACSRSDRGANSSTVSKVSATVERSGSTRSIREDKVRTLIRTTWLTGPNDDSPAIPPVPWTTPAGGASTDPAVGAAIADPADGHRRDGRGVVIRAGQPGGADQRADLVLADRPGAARSFDRRGDLGDRAGVGAAVAAG